MIDRMLPPQEVSELLGVEQRTLYSWRQAGTGPPSVRLGKYVRYPASALQKWLDERQGESRRAG